MTANDLRVLRAAAEACETWDGFMPHGSSDWVAIRRLVREQLVEANNDWANCQTCAEPHEGPSFTVTVWGHRALAAQEPTDELG